MKNKNYRRTFIACYLGFITQAIAANFAPLLFLTFNRSFNISLGSIALIPTAFFMTQLIVDILCAKYADRIGYRACVVSSQAFSAAGLIGLAFIPSLLPSPFVGILICTIIYAIGSGLTEVLCSPIVEACPSEHKEAAMSLLHSFYCWGSVMVILFSSIFFAIFGMESWRLLSCIWAAVPIINIFNFLTCPIEMPVEEGKGLGIRGLMKTPVFWLMIILMICAGSSELSMSQWASAFAESGLGLSKLTGDIAGPCLFAVMMGLSRALYGKFGDRIDLMKFMLGSGALCLICYLTASLSGAAIIGLLGCIICGFSVGIMWPGTISICSKRIPEGGTAMFALLAMAGDMGGSAGPALVGAVSQQANDSLKVGILSAAVFPLILVICIAVLKFLHKTKTLKILHIP